MSDTVLYDVADGVATITLNRPDRLNAVSDTMRGELFGDLRRADADDAVRVIVITGAGRGFCAGADTSRLETVSGEDIRAAELGPDEVGMDQLRKLRKPLIAAVNGACAGLGFCLATLADIRIVAADAKITTSFSRLGLPAESGAAWALPRLVGTGRALDLLYSSRVIDGEEAERIGWAQACHPVDGLAAAVTAYAGTLASRSAHSLRVMREQVADDAGRSFDEAFRAAAELTAEAVERPAFQALLADRPRGD